MKITSTNITIKNLINKYNNSIYESAEDDMLMIDMYIAS
jgi:hypothetical protein